MALKVAHQDVLVPRLKHCAGFQLAFKLHEDREAMSYGLSMTTALRSAPLRTESLLHHDVVGLGRRMSLPPSSHDMLKSERTLRTRDTMIEGVITLLWMPIKNRITNMMLLIVKNM